MKKVCFIFPGQGAQYVGMGKDLYENLPEAKKIFDEAEKILPHAGIKRLCFEGPLEELTQTKNSQVAILVTSIAALEAFKSKVEGGGCRVEACAGLSLGELTALVAAESIKFNDAVKLVRRRGELMEETSLKHPGSMASILGLPIETLEEVCKETGAEIANLNCPGQVVLSGTKDAIKNAMALSEKKGAKKAMVLNVSGPFHSSLMKEAGEFFSIELNKVHIKSPQIPVVSNVTGDYESSAEEIKENLAKQLSSPVRWEDSVRRIAGDGCAVFYEIGPGKVLKGLLGRIDEKVVVKNIGRMEDMQTL